MRTLKFTTLLLLLLFAKTTILAQEQEHSLTVTISNIESNEGTIQVGLYNSKSSFLNIPYTSTSIQAKKGSLQIAFKNVPKGTYAVSLYHDKDNNKKLNTFFKIPTEPYGVSNNAKGKFGPPNWEEAKFSILDKNTSQSIQL
ncbi:DUF2141 domain-containing protein [Aquimarina muelleri]|uniref:DUF2141 domain-containing protein n=1 Tax=Aquimarina muelleri TaxID=279356 RepID=UPI003F6835F3